MLKSSILGKEFVNYRKLTNEDERITFSDKIRKKGVGNIPVVIDSVEKDLSLLLAKHDPIFPRNIRFGFELDLHMDIKVYQLIDIIKNEMKNKIDIIKPTFTLDYTFFSLGLEDGTIIDNNEEVGTIYKKHRNKDDKILYILITKENTILGYIKSIIKYLLNKAF